MWILIAELLGAGIGIALIAWLGRQAVRTRDEIRSAEQVLQDIFQQH